MWKAVSIPFSEGLAILITINISQNSISASMVLPNSEGSSLGILSSVAIELSHLQKKHSWITTRDKFGNLEAQGVLRHTRKSERKAITSSRPLYDVF